MTSKRSSPRLVTAATLLLAAFSARAFAQGRSPLTLGEAIDQSLAHHPSVASVRANSERAAAALREANAALLPTLVVSEDATYSNDPVFAFGSKLRQARFAQSDLTIDSLNHPGATANFSASAICTWTVFDSGRQHRIAAAVAAQKAVDLEGRYTAEELSARVVVFYYRVLVAEHEREVAKHVVRRTGELDLSIADRVRAGISLETDGTRAHLDERRAEDDLVQAIDNVDLARHDLFAAMGVAFSDQPLLEAAAPTKERFEEPAAASLEQRQDIQALDAQIVAAKDRKLEARSGIFPKISAFGHVENDAQKVFSSGNGNWTIAAKVQLSLFDGGSRKAHEDASSAEVQELEARKRSELLAADSAVNSLRTQLGDLLRRLATAGDSISVQQETLQTARDRYDAGLASLTDVLSAETDLSQAEFSAVKTRYQFLITSAELALATGNSLHNLAGQQ